MTRNTRSKIRILFLVLAICAFCVCLVYLNATSSKLQYEINSLNNKITEASWDVRNLEVSVKKQTNITNLEAKAAEIGMVFPGFKDIVYLRGDTPEVQDFAIALKENIYR